MVEQVLRKIKSEKKAGVESEQAEKLRKSIPKYITKQRRLAVEAYKQAYELYAPSYDAMAALPYDLELKAANVSYQIGLAAL